MEIFCYRDELTVQASDSMAVVTPDTVSECQSHVSTGAYATAMCVLLCWWYASGCCTVVLRLLEFRLSFILFHLTSVVGTSNFHI
jgi:hypothetical protein